MVVLADDYCECCQTFPTCAAMVTKVNTLEIVPLLSLH